MDMTPAAPVRPSSKRHPTLDTASTPLSSPRGPLDAENPPIIPDDPASPRISPPLQPVLSTYNAASDEDAASSACAAVAANAEKAHSNALVARRNFMWNDLPGTDSWIKVTFLPATARGVASHRVVPSPVWCPSITISILLVNCRPCCSAKRSDCDTFATATGTRPPNPSP